MTHRKAEHQGQRGPHEPHAPPHPGCGEAWRPDWSLSHRHEGLSFLVASLVLFSCQERSDLGYKLPDTVLCSASIHQAPPSGQGCGPFHCPGIPVTCCLFPPTLCDHQALHRPPTSTLRLPSAWMGPGRRAILLAFEPSLPLPPPASKGFSCGLAGRLHANCP